MSIDVVILNKLQVLCSHSLTLANKEATESFCENEVHEFGEFCSENYPKLCEYDSLIKDNKIEQVGYCEILEKIRAESFELKNNLKLMLQLSLTLSKLMSDEGFYNEREKWLNKINIL
jgi:hypothetical protein